jgi:uncharacterized protein YndB with AHSA1/START domain
VNLASPWSAVEVRQSISATRDEVFNTVSDPKTYPEWLVGAQRIRHVTNGFAESGDKFDHSVGPTESLTVDDSTYLVESQGHRRLVLEVHAGPIAGEVEFVFKKGSSTTEVTMRERPAGAGVVLTPLIRPLLGLRNRRSLQQLARYIEHRDAPA